MRFKNLPSRNHLGNASLHHWVWDSVSLSNILWLCKTSSLQGWACTCSSLPAFLQVLGPQEEAAFGSSVLTVGTFTAHINSMLLFLRLPHSLFLETSNRNKTPAALPCSTFPRLALPNVFGVCYTPSSPQYNASYCVITQFVYSALDYNFCKEVVVWYCLQPTYTHSYSYIRMHACTAITVESLHGLGKKHLNRQVSRWISMKIIGGF